MARELMIQGPDGKLSTHPLSGAKLAVGRSSSVELSFPEDAGLSRQHFAFEAQGDEWTVQDLGSKNGTFVNNIPLKARLILKPGDRITAGHLNIVYCPDAKGPSNGVVIFEGDEEDTTHPTSSTLVTSLDGALNNQTLMTGIAPRPGAKTSAPFKALLDAGLELSKNRPLEEMFPVILNLAIKAVNAQRGVVMVLEGDTLVPKAHKGDGFRISSAVREQVIKDKASLLVRDAQLDEALKMRMSIVEQRVHTMMAVPLQSADRIIGLIYVDSPFVLREFTKDDLDLLTVMANIAATRVEGVRLAEVEQAERVMKRDLSQAAEIQQRILPEKAPEVPGLDLAGFNQPCRTVGGDYYGFFTYPAGRVALCLGDVSGKGMAAALMVMAFEARLRVVAEDPTNAAALVVRLNKITCANCPSNRFITFFFGILDPASGELAFANAGHNPPIVVRAAGGSEMLEGGGPVLGVLSIAPYSEEHARLGPGDLLVIYSDGVTEATNTSGEEYGEERLIEMLESRKGGSADEILRSVVESLNNFTSGAPQADDITLMVAKRVAS
jgi:serine phosphatase RsbU (regulator of sigma subunit)